MASTHPRKEQLAQQHLSRQNFETFVPRFKRQRPGRNVAEIVPLFPGYIFIALDLNRHYWQPINSTRGVRHLLCSSGGQPLPVPPAAMELLQERCPQGILTNKVTDFEIGAQVKMTVGPLAHRIASVEGLDKLGRVRILFDLLGIENSIAVDPAVLAPLAA